MNNKQLLGSKQLTMLEAEELRKELKRINRELPKFIVAIKQTGREKNLWRLKREILAKLNPLNNLIDLNA